MKIRAIRLKEVGRFRDPVALEKLTGGLDVLAGPNEFGKSTILRAVKLALFEQHKSKKAKTVEALRPYAGGAPLIEVDFEIDGNLWRIRKQFLAHASAELKDLQAGRVWRGGDAEYELSRLLTGGTGKERFALLWVEQGGSLEVLNPAATAGGALNAALEAEVETVAGGTVARLVRAKVKQELATFVTSHNPPRATGAYKTALDERADLEQKCDTARERLRIAQARLDQLAGIRAKVSQMSNPSDAASRAAAATAARAAFDEARNARGRHQQAEQAWQVHEERLIRMKEALEAHKGRVADLAKLEDAARREAPEMEELARRIAECGASVAKSRSRRDEIKLALEAVEQELKTLVLAERVMKAEERLRGARALANESKVLSNEIAKNRADDALVAAARREASTVATLEARLSAAAPQVSISYAPGSVSQIRVDGRALETGEILRSSQPIALEIEGVGVVTVAPGHSDSADADQADLAAHEQELRTLLERAGVASIDEAEERLRARRVLEGKLTEVCARFKAQAPEGLENLERIHAEAVAEGKRSRRTSLDVQDELKARGEALSKDLVEAEAQLEQVLGAHEKMGREHARFSARVDERSKRIAEAPPQLLDRSARAGEMERLSAAVTEAQNALNAAVRELTAWKERAPSDARLSELQFAAEHAEGALAVAERDLAEVRHEEAGLEGELKADRADDVGAHLAELEGMLGAATARAQNLAGEIATLQLLDRKLTSVANETREQYAKPVLNRLTPYMRLVFPEATLRLGDGFSPEELRRGSDRELLASLSKGTQEQLAVLVRLGFGRLLAETGSPAPLILDDALVYSDDQRIEDMFAVLKSAAQSHQVLVLTCRERTFAGLCGQKIALIAWDPG